MPGARSTTVINGTDLGVYDGSTLVGASTTCSINVNRDVRDVSNKDSAGWKKVLPAQKSWTVTVEALHLPNSTVSYDTLYTKMVNGTAITLKWQNKANTAGDMYYQGTAYITSMSQTAPNEGNVTYSVTFQGDGAITATDPLTA